MGRDLLSRYGFDSGCKGHMIYLSTSVMLDNPNWPWTTHRELHLPRVTLSSWWY